nr:hypothetical protein [Tanacetum cinerariifolium]
MRQKNYVEECSMKIPPLLEPNGFCFWKDYFETYFKSKDIDLWQVIQNDNFYYNVEDSETKLMKEISYELIEDDQKKKLWKNNEAKMTLYNALPRKEYAKYSCVKPPRRFGRGRENSFGNKGGESLKKKGVGYNCEIEAHFASECKMSKETKAFVRGAWSGNEDGDEHQNGETYLMEIKSQE